jgi:hypothetical protein
MLQTTLNSNIVRGGIHEQTDAAIESAFTGFSCPFETFDEALAETVAGEYARVVLGRFLDEFESDPVLQASGVSPLLSQLQGADIGFELAWSSALGNLYGAVRSHDRERARRRVAAFALLAGAHGISCEWELSFNRPSLFIWENRILPTCDRLHLHSDGNQAIVTTYLHDRPTRISFTLLPEQKEWYCDRPDLVELLPVIRGGARSIALLSKNIACESDFFEDDTGNDALESFPPLLLETHSNALCLLEEKLNPFHLWVTRIIRRMTVLHSAQDFLLSGSHENQLGTIYISDNLRPLAVAEMLIHEASHQYLELISKLGPTIDPSHRQMYYSPIKQCSRPLSKILLAYHAFANVMLFYRDILNSGLDDGFVSHLQPKLAEDLRQLEQPLRNTDALTSIGRALVEPLINREVC